MSYDLAISPSDLQFFVTSDPIDSVPQIPHEGDYTNSEQFENLSRQQLLEKPIAVAEDDTLENEFHDRATEWRQETMGVSSLSDMFLHPAYQRIMGMGKPALRFILRDLKEHSGDWFHALHYIAGKDVAAGTETVEDAKAAWLEWGYREDHI